MSFGLEIRSDEQYSKRLPLTRTARFIRGLPDVTSNCESSTAFIYELQQAERCMFIEIGLMDAEEGVINEPTESTGFNCIEFSIPYGYFRRESWEKEYLPLAERIASKAGWPLYDPQTDETWYPPGIWTQLKRWM